MSQNQRHNGYPSGNSAAQRSFAPSELSLNIGAAEFVPGRSFYSQDVRANPYYQRSNGYGESSSRSVRPAGRGISRKRNENLPQTDETVSGSLSERIAKQLTREQYECLVCCEAIRLKHAVWSCSSCYSVFHLRCVKRWANSSSDAEGWRCPGCQKVTAEVPEVYVCFCGRMRNPPVAIAGQITPHSCGDPCEKPRKDNCKHKCPDLCHPGPCNFCPVIVDRKCHCGKTSQKIQCGSDKELQCNEVCGKLLNCAFHRCEAICHTGDCAKCDKTLQQDCFCGRSSQVVPCSRESLNVTQFICAAICDKLLECGNHHCSLPCHPGCCELCLLTPDRVTHCPCGKTPLSSPESRQNCTDPIPTCDQICSKPLNCGSPGEPHICQIKCHQGECPHCSLQTEVSCRCQKSTVTISCAELVVRNLSQTPVLCTKRCKKQKNCQRHKCNEVCCIDPDHICTLICGYKLSCGIHTCEALCHSGKCLPCYVASFEELTCECGTNVLYPPIRCGTKRPACDQPCPRAHPCEHPVAHNCHSEPKCPPCTVLTRKFCYGKHVVRNNIPCYLDDVSCGKPCSKPLGCGHNCNRTCHPGECAVQPCVQPCPKPRDSCGHCCALPCHGDTPCPADSICRQPVQLTCCCGNRKSRLTCVEFEKQMASLQQRRSSSDSSDAENSEKVDKPDAVKILKRPATAESDSPQILVRQNSQDKYQCLPCNGECKRIERNRQLAVALDIETPDLTGSLDIPTYTDFLKSQAKTSGAAVLSVEKDLVELVSLANTSTAASRSHVFQPMNRDQRRIIHEYAEYFDIQTVSYDQEPQRNVVATAKKGKSRVPLKLLSQMFPAEGVKQPIMRFGPKSVASGQSFWK